MKKLIFILFITLIGCSDNQIDLTTIEVGEMINYRFENDIQVDDPYSAFDYVYNNIIYKNENIDFWQLPETTYQEKSGDCEDFTILFMYILDTRLSIQSSMIITYDSINDKYHSVVLCNDDYFDATSGSIDSYIETDNIKIKYIIPYPEVIWMTYYYHDNVGKYYF